MKTVTLKNVVLTAAVAAGVFAGEAKTVALWPLGDNVASSRAGVCARCVNNSAFNLSVSNATVDATLPGNWNLPPNPCADLSDPYKGIVRYSVQSSAADASLSRGIVYADNKALAQYMYPTNDFTIEGWVRFDEFDTSKNWRVIVQAGKGSGGSGGWCLSMRYNAKTGFYLNMYSHNKGSTDYPTMTDTAYYNFIDGTTAVTWADLEGSWHHYAVSFDYDDAANDGKSMWRVYFDGRLAGTSDNKSKFPTGYSIGSANEFDLGGRTSKAAQRVKGAFSYWRLSDEVLEPEKFLNYTAGGTQTGTLVDGEQPTWTALDLNTRGGSQSRWANTGVRVTGDAVSNCTFETWLSVASESYVMSQYSGANYRSTWSVKKWATSDGGDDLLHLEFQILSPTAGWIYIRSAKTIDKGTWHHVALVIDHGVFRFYIDGQLDTEEDYPGLHLATDETECDGVVIGSFRLWDDPYAPFGSASARFAEARVWSRARTAGEIRAAQHCRLADSANEPDLIGHWPLCDGEADANADGFVAYNYAKLDAETSGFPQREAAAVGYSPICCHVTNGVWKSYSDLEITGAAPHAVYSAFCPEKSCSYAATTDLTNSYDRFTFTGWYFFSAKSATGSRHPLVTKSQSGNGRLDFRERNGGELQLWIGGGTGGATNEELVVSAEDAGLHYGRWTHLAVVRRGRVFSIYVDGVLKGRSGAFTLSTHPTAPFQFGGYDAGGSSGIFNGLVREVGLWQTALTDAEVAQTMTKRPTGTEGKLLGYWPCDDGAGSLLRNLKAGGAAATPVGGSGISFRWRSLATVPTCDGILNITRPGFLMMWW